MAKWFFRHGELPLVVLALLDRSPMNGYEVIGELDRLFADAYDPSTGSVYPAIKALQLEGLVTGSPYGPRRGQRLELTETGRAALARRGEQLAAVQLRTGVRIRGAASLDALVDEVAATARALAPAVPEDEIRDVLDTTLAQLQCLAETSERRSS